MISKFRSVVILSLVVATVTFYSSCKKDATSTNGADKTKIGAQLAVSLYQSLSTSFNNKNGATTSSIGTKRTTLADNLCGTFKEVPVNEISTQGDTVKDTYTGYYRFVYNCDSTSKVNGYTQSDSIVNAGFNTAKTYNRLVKEFLTVTKIGTDFTKLSVNGSHYSLIQSQSKTNAAESSSQTNNFTLTSLVLEADGNKMTIKSGAATFNCTGTNDGTAFNFTGTITFLTGYKATVTFDGKTYLVNLLTGETTLQA
ncbi:hypothetical protein FFF34_007025 [Inquilinus sp. KBS0705]|nr:hypothetical protein FFF34_007025 [Inquilinus sp. KBS0705]